MNHINKQSRIQMQSSLSEMYEQKKSQKWVDVLLITTDSILENTYKDALQFYHQDTIVEGLNMVEDYVMKECRNYCFGDNDYKIDTPCITQLSNWLADNLVMFLEQLENDEIDYDNLYKNNNNK